MGSFAAQGEDVRDDLLQFFATQLVIRGMAKDQTIPQGVLHRTVVATVLPRVVEQIGPVVAHVTNGISGPVGRVTVRAVLAVELLARSAFWKKLLAANRSQENKCQPGEGDRSIDRLAPHGSYSVTQML